jgi:ABC-2 type transport system permease protein
MTAAYALRDSTTMLRRQLRHLLRYPGLSLFPILMPVVFLLLFVYVFGGTLGNGIVPGGGRRTYIDFLTPGMLLFTVAGAAQITAISVAKDMAEGIIARFKTMRNLAARGAGRPCARQPAADPRQPRRADRSGGPGRL